MQVSEAIAVLVVLSESFRTLLSRPLMETLRAGRPAEDVMIALVSAIVGGSDGTASGALAALVSSQVDADKLDYMARDAHHAGLPIDFDTERLISKLEAVTVEKAVLSRRLENLHEKVNKAAGGRYQEVGISAGGTGAFEQMLVGRIFLYDRLYHHHKVRAADAMAQRLIYYAEPSRSALSLAILYPPLPDDAVIHAFGGLIKVGPEITPVPFPTTEASSELAAAILGRRLYKRAFAFAGRFVAGLDADDALAADEHDVWTEEDKDAERSRVMNAVNLALAELDDRLSAEAEITTLAIRIGEAFPTAHILNHQSQGLAPHHVVVDLPRSPHPARITTIARGDDGRLDVPDVFYDPARWADAYATQRRTGYVFAHPDRRVAISVAARIWFLRRLGCVFDQAAERQAKTTTLLNSAWFDELEKTNLISNREKDYLVRPRLLYVPLKLSARHVPRSWQETDPDFIENFNRGLSDILPEGMSALAEQDLVQALRGMFRTLQTWADDGSFVTSVFENEKELQSRLREALRQRDLDVVEGSERAGGETDLTVGRRVIIENKLLRGLTDDPFAEIPRTGLQGRRYVLPTGQRFVITAVGYQAKTESGHLSPSACVKVMPLTNVEPAFAEIRVAIRYGDNVPSRAGMARGS